MAVETFFLMGFRAMSDMIKEIFPPGEENALVKSFNEFQSKDPEGRALLKLIEDILRKIKEIAFEDKGLRFHLIKQLEPAFGYKLVLKLDPIPPIAIAFNKNKDIFEVSNATEKDMKEFPGIVFPFNLFKRFLVEDLDVLKFITEGQIQFEKFLELDEIIVRALLGFSSAYFLREKFRDQVIHELPTVLGG